MSQVKLNDGTVFDCLMCGAAEGVLWVEIPSLSILEAAEIFSNSEATQIITAYTDVVFEGYTKLIRLMLDENIKIALRKEL